MLNYPCHLFFCPVIYFHYYFYKACKQDFYRRANSSIIFGSTGDLKCVLALILWLASSYRLGPSKSAKAFVLVLATIDSLF
jgi:hypothetical protein